jgi:predicted nuclease with TOPRIM domain
MSAEKSLDSVNDQISKLEADILDVENNCAEFVKILKETKDTLVEKQLDALYNKLDKLRDEKNSLRGKEKSLIDKENLLRTRMFKLSDETQGPAGELLCGSAY